MSETSDRLARIRKANRRELGLEGPVAGMNGVGRRVGAAPGVPFRRGGAPQGSFWRDGASAAGWNPKYAQDLLPVPQKDPNNALQGLHDFVWINPILAGQPSPQVAPQAYFADGRQLGTGNGWQWQQNYPTLNDPVPQQPALFPTMAPVYQRGAFAGLGAVAGPSAQQKAEISKFAKAAIKSADAYRATGNPAVDQSNYVAASAALEGARSQLTSNRWSGSSWGITEPPYDSWDSLFQGVQEAKVRLMAKSSTRREDGKPLIDPRAADPRTGKVRVDSPAAAAAGSLAQSGKEAGQAALDFFGELKKLVDSPKKLLVAGAVGVGIYAFASGAGKGLLSGRKRRR